MSHQHDTRRNYNQKCDTHNSNPNMTLLYSASAKAPRKISLMSRHKKVFNMRVTPLTRRYRVDHIHLHHTYLAGKWTLDHVESRYKSIRGHTGAIVISNGNFVAVYPTASKGDQDSTESLRRFTEDVGIPANLKVDMASAFVGRHTDFQRLAQRLGINMTYAEPYRHNQLQQVDVAIRELKRRWRNKMGCRYVP